MPKSLLAGTRCGPFIASTPGCATGTDGLAPDAVGSAGGANRRRVDHRADARVVPSRPALGPGRVGPRHRRSVRPAPVEPGSGPTAHAGLDGQALHHWVRTERPGQRGPSAY